MEVLSTYQHECGDTESLIPESHSALFNSRSALILTITTLFSILVLLAIHCLPQRMRVSIRSPYHKSLHSHPCEQYLLVHKIGHVTSEAEGSQLSSNPNPINTDHTSIGRC